MASRRVDGLAAVSTFVRQGRPFTICHVPKRGVPYLIARRRKTIHLVCSLRRLGKREKFIVTPFQPGRAYPVLLVRSGKPKRPLLLTSSTSTIPQSVPSASCPSYSRRCTRYFHAFVDTLHSGAFRGLILSHGLAVKGPSTFSPSLTFHTTYRHCVRSCVCLYCAPRANV